MMRSLAENLSWGYDGTWLLLHSYSLDHFSTSQECEKSATVGRCRSFAGTDNRERQRKVCVTDKQVTQYENELYDTFIPLGF